jgi:hypothetical protein
MENGLYREKGTKKMIEQNNWIDEIFASEWFVVENIARIIRQAGYPEVYYEAYISTSPEKNRGHRLANIQRWVGPPDYNGEIERRVGHHLVDLHNALVKAEKGVKHKAAQPLPKRKKRNVSPEARARMLANLWPKDVPHLYHPDGRPMKLKECRQVMKDRS